VGDFGCGTGVLLHVLGDRPGRYTGIDFSADFIAAARRRAAAEDCRNYEFVEAEIVDYCHRHPANFDIATALDFAEHVETDLAIRIFSAIRISLRAGGRFYLHTPNLDFFVERAKDIGILEQFPEHIAVRNTVQMRSLLESSGFEREQIKIEAISHYNVLRLLHPLSKIPLIGRLFEARLLITATA
jgi:SAM-dependent methyltransferase